MPTKVHIIFYIPMSSTKSQNIPYYWNSFLNSLIFPWEYNTYTPCICRYTQAAWAIHNSAFLVPLGTHHCWVERAANSEKFAWRYHIWPTLGFNPRPLKFKCVTLYILLCVAGVFFPEPRLKVWLYDNFNIIHGMHGAVMSMTNKFS